MSISRLTTGSAPGVAAATAPCRSLGAYITELLARLAEGDPSAMRRMASVVGSRRAGITLDDETVEVVLREGAARVEEPGGGPVDGAGKTDRATVHALLDGYLEASDAIVDGWIEVRGRVDDIGRIFQAIEILLDAAPRLPALQELARDFRRDPCRDPRRAEADALPRRRRTRFPRSEASARGMEVLRRLDLLP